LGWAGAAGVRGYALDDAWIHQTYARNLAATGQFAFVPGQPSSGSTSPLWTLLVALGYALRAHPLTWTYALGALCLALTALGVWQLSLRLFPQHPRAALIAGLFCALEWHLVWAATSGMETALFTALAVWLMVAIQLPASDLRPPSSVLRLASSVGLLSGLLVLTRPEGMVLVGLALASVLVARGWTQRANWTGWAWALAILAALLIPWLAFNWRASGTPFPNTFYAKQREYAEALAALTLWQRFAQVFSVPCVGAQVLLLPGLLAAMWARLRRLGQPSRGFATWAQLAPPAWAIMHLSSYALRLPVTYQHGRYEMPVIPVIIILGMGGTASLLQWQDCRLWPRVLSRAAVLAILVTQLGFVALGARAYAADVALIEGEMVQVARWLAANTQPDDLIAAHDIGALGYFAPRRLLDLAGLVSPEVIPFIRDEPRLNSLIRQRGARYLVAFPAWYPHLVSQPSLAPVFSGNAQGAPEHLTVYRLP
jgi:hypothetical protein